MPAVTAPVQITANTVPVLLTFPSTLQYGVQLVALASNDKFAAFGSDATVAVSNTTGIVTAGAIIPQAATTSPTFSVTPQLIPQNLFKPGQVFGGGVYIVASTGSQVVNVMPA